MKRKKLLFTIVAILLCPCAMAQIYASQQVYDYSIANGNHTIVRSWDNDHIVTFYVENEKPVLEVLEISTNNIRRAVFQGSYYFRDMVIDNGILYFCGSTSYYYTGYIMGNGLLGRIDLSDFSNTFINIDLLTIPQLTTINKLVEYDNGGVSHIVAIGEEVYSIAPYTYSQYYFVDCQDIESLYPTYIVEKFSTEERYDDVLLTSRFVVFMGYYNDALSPSICYRKMDRSNIYSTVFNNIILFAGGDDAVSITHSTAMDMDNIATSYLAFNQSGNPVTRIRMINAAAETNTNSQELLLPEKEEPIHLVYIPFTGAIVLMENFDVASDYHSNFVYIDPMSQSSYVSSVEYKISDFFQFLTLHRSTYFLAAAGASWYFRDITVSPVGFIQPDCPSYQPFKINIINNLVSNILYKPINMLTNNIIIPQPPAPVVSAMAQIGCFN